MLFKEFKYAMIFSFVSFSSLFGIAPELLEMAKFINQEVINANDTAKKVNTYVKQAIITVNQKAENAKSSIQQETQSQLNTLNQAGGNLLDSINGNLKDMQTRTDEFNAGIKNKHKEAFDSVEPQIKKAAIDNATAVEKARLVVQIKGAKELAAAAEQGKFEAQATPEGRAAMKVKAKSDEQVAIAVEQEKNKKDGLNDKLVKADKEKNEFKWTSISGIFSKIGAGLSSPKTMFKVSLGIAICGIAYYGIKHGMPVLIAKLVQPKVVSESSRKSWFGSKTPQQDLNLKELTFGGDLKVQLNDITENVRSSVINKENLPNVLLYGPPGTGKTAFAKALAYALKDDKGNALIDYALTSGSEFAKIKDLNIANNELRKLLNWGKNSSKPLLIFIDEAESLFANRKLPSTSKDVTDFINTFLALVSDKSQKNLMFIFATNHPFKLDEAIANRIGFDVEFKLPEEAECAKILEDYVHKFSKPLDKKPGVTLGSNVSDKLKAKNYGKELVGLAPRGIKFVAEEMVKMARRTSNQVLTQAIVEKTLIAAKKEVIRTEKRDIERDKYAHDQLVAARA